MSANVPAEPSPDPVADALRMRASDADRERVAGILRDAYVEGRLSPVEHEERLAEAYRATTYGDLVPVLRDLPVPPGTIAVPVSRGVELSAPPASGATGLQVRPGQVPEGERNMVAVFGAFERKGAWTVPAEMTSTCIFGGGELDLTEAVLTSMETVLTATCIFGGLEITVPHGMVVRCEAIGVFGGSEVPKDVTPEGAPVLVIKGAAIFGGISVRRPKPPKRSGITKG
jgi:hypothetical protein